MSHDALRHLRRTLSRIIRGKRDVLLHACSPMNIVVMRPIIDALQRDPRIRLILAAKFRTRDDAPAMIAATRLKDVEPMKRRAAHKYRADLYIAPDGSRVAGKRSYRRMLTFHGASFKGRSIAKKAKFFDKIMLVGPWQRRQFIARKFIKEGDPRLVEIGMPKLDPLVNGSIDVRALRARLGIDPSKKVVLYAPTWGEHSSIFKMGEAMLERASRIDGIHVLVKLHDHLKDPNHSKIDWEARAKAWPWKNVSLYEDIDVVPAMALADVLISDASSVLQEFMLLDRPIVYCDVPELFQSKRYRKTADVDTWSQKGGIVIKTGDEIAAALDRCFSDPSEFSAARRAIANDVFYNPGIATQRALELVYSELGLPLPRRESVTMARA